MTAILELKDVSIEFPVKDKSEGGSRKATVKPLTDVNLDVHPGEVIAVVGESGCGKTTLGKVISGLHSPTKGSITYKGEDVKSLKGAKQKAYRKNIQVVQQNSYAALNPAKTIFQSLAAPITKHKLVRGKKQKLNKVTELLETVGLRPVEQYLDKFPHQLSGGQRQRVLMARAISLNPEVIIADEPVSMVDVSLRLALLDLMARLNREFNIAFIYITHDLATARFIAQNGRLAVMYLGQVVELNSVLDIMRDPKHPYLQALLTAVPIPDPKIAKSKRELPLKGLEVPSLIHPPSGCGFHPRCLYATETCHTERPNLRRVGKGDIACHHAEGIPKWSLTASSS